MLKKWINLSFIVLVCATLHTNNIFSQSRSHIDLKFKELTMDNKQPRKGDKVLFTITAEKKGTGKTEKVRLVCKLRHYQIIDQELDFTSQNSITVKYEWSALPGNQVFKCIIDSNYQYPETDELNNEAKLEFTVALPRLPNIPYKDFILIPDSSASFVRMEGLPNARRQFELPDLVPIKITLDSNKNTANLYIRNTGIGFSANWKYKISWSEMGAEAESCEVVKSGVIKSYANFQVNCQLPSEFFSKYVEKTLQFKAAVDTTNKVEENDELNNIYFESIKVRREQPKIVIN